jgi:hypothetical protein
MERKMDESHMENPGRSRLLTFFVTFQIAPFLWLVICPVVSIIPSFVNSVFVLALVCVNVYLTSGFFGKALIGLSWRIECLNPQNGVFAFDIVPDPFVPGRIDSIVFWGCLIGSTLIWSGIFMTSLFDFFAGKRGLDVIVMCTFSMIVNGGNLICFFRIGRIAAKESVKAVKVLLLGDDGEFPKAEEVNDGGEEEAREPPMELE